MRFRAWLKHAPCIIRWRVDGSINGGIKRRAGVLAERDDNVIQRLRHFEERGDGGTVAEAL